MTRMVVYFILGIISLIFFIMFATNKYPFQGYKNCEDEKAKKIYRRGGFITSILLFVGFFFMGFYDLSINLSNEMIPLEGFGLFSLLFGVVALIFFVLLFHNRIIEVTKEENEAKEAKKISEDCKNIDKENM